MQIFWTLLMIGGGNGFGTIGIADMFVLIGIWVITRIPDNLIMGGGGPISQMVIANEVFQIAYIAIAAIILAKVENQSPLRKRCKPVLS